MAHRPGNKAESPGEWSRGSEEDVLLQSSVEAEGRVEGRDFATSSHIAATQHPTHTTVPRQLH